MFLTAKHLYYCEECGTIKVITKPMLSDGDQVLQRLTDKPDVICFECSCGHRGFRHLMTDGFEVKTIR